MKIYTWNFVFSITPVHIIHAKTSIYGCLKHRSCKWQACCGPWKPGPCQLLRLFIYLFWRRYDDIYFENSSLIIRWYLRAEIKQVGRWREFQHVSLHVKFISKSRSILIKADRRSKGGRIDFSFFLFRERVIAIKAAAPNVSWYSSMSASSKFKVETEKADEYALWSSKPVTWSTWLSLAAHEICRKKTLGSIAES